TSCFNGSPTQRLTKKTERENGFSVCPPGSDVRSQAVGYVCVCVCVYLCVCVCVCVCVCLFVSVFYVLEKLHCLACSIALVKEALRSPLPLCEVTPTMQLPWQ